MNGSAMESEIEVKKFIENNWDLFLLVCRRLCREEETAQELRQELVLHILDHNDQWRSVIDGWRRQPDDPSRQIKRYLLLTARNLREDMIRSRVGRIRPPEKIAEEGPSYSLVWTLLYQREWPSEEVNRLVANLPGIGDASKVVRTVSEVVASDPKLSSGAAQAATGRISVPLNDQIIDGNAPVMPVELEEERLRLELVPAAIAYLESLIAATPDNAVEWDGLSLKLADVCSQLKPEKFYMALLQHLKSMPENFSLLSFLQRHPEFRDKSDRSRYNDYRRLLGCMRNLLERMIATVQRKR